MCISMCILESAETFLCSHLLEFDWDCIESVSNLQRTDILEILSVWMCRHSVALHLFRS